METTIAKSSTGNGRSLWRFVLNAAVSIALLWLTLRHTPVAAVLQQIAAFDWEALIGALLMLAASTLVAALRWSLILGALGMARPLCVTYPLSLIGVFFGQALPAGVGGDVVRVWLGCRSGLSARVSISSILAARLTGLFAILLIVTVELPEIHRVFPDSAMFYALLTMLVAAYAGFVILMVLDKVPTKLLSFKIVRGFARVSTDLRAILMSPGVCMPVVLYGAIIQLGNVLAIFFLALGLRLHLTFRKRTSHCSTR